MCSMQQVGSWIDHLQQGQSYLVGEPQSRGGKKINLNVGKATSVKNTSRKPTWFVPCIHTARALD